jgi:hypothetical protein
VKRCCVSLRSIAEEHLLQGSVIDRSCPLVPDALCSQTCFLYEDKVSLYLLLAVLLLLAKIFSSRSDVSGLSHICTVLHFNKIKR